MLQIVNHTPFAAALSVFPDLAGVETVHVTVKATFALDGYNPFPLPASRQMPLLAGDIYRGDPTQTSLRAAGELAPPRPATDVLLHGRAVAPGPNTREADVELRVGPVRRRVRVIGDRHWERAGVSWRPSAPAPWQRMPLIWELAFGGIAMPEREGAPPEVEARNPVGRGYVARGASPVAGAPLPNLEDPVALIQDPESRPAPVGFGPIAPVWLPRRAYAGTYDEAWTKERAPYLPLDFDPRFFQLAPQGLVAPAFLRGGESIELTGFSLGAPLSFTLPSCGLDTEFHFDGQPANRPANLEMVLFEPDAGRLQMLWRASLAVDKRLTRMAKVDVRSSVYESTDPEQTILISPDSQLAFELSQ